MRMIRHTLKLVALAAVFSFAPALAGQSGNAKAWHHCCPRKHAAAAAVHQSQQASGATVIKLSDRVPLDGSLFDLGRRGLITP
jgi:hypothetical protein